MITKETDKGHTSQPNHKEFIVVGPGEDGRLVVLDGLNCEKVEDAEETLAPVLTMQGTALYAKVESDE